MKILAFAAVALCLGAGVVWPQPEEEDRAQNIGTDPTFVIRAYSVDSGGATSVGGQFLLRGTIAQPDVGTQTGGPFLMSGGFWQALSGIIFSDDFESGDDSAWSESVP